MSLLAPYVAILRRPGTLKFSAAAFLARLPISMVGLGIVLLVSATTGSYGEAGATTAAYAVTNAVLAPVCSRYVDRWGQRTVVALLVTAHALALAMLVIAVVARWPLALTLALAAVAGATQPATGALVRARWAVALGGDSSLRTAFAFESLLDEVIFVLGPPLATALAVFAGAATPLLACVALVTSGCVLLLVQRSTEPPRRPASTARHRTLLRQPGVVFVVLAMMATGSVFGSVDVVVVAAADEQGVRWAAGIVLAGYAFGSMLSALFLGARSHAIPDAWLAPQFLVASGLLAASTVAFAVSHGLIAIGLVALAAGVTVSPVLITAFTLIERIVPEGQLTEGLTWTASGIGLGVAMSAFVAGLAVDQAGSGAGFAVTAVAGPLTLLVAAAGYRTLRRECAEAVAGRTAQ